MGYPRRPDIIDTTVVLNMGGWELTEKGKIVFVIYLLEHILINFVNVSLNLT